jgi:molecular chaperone GrpE (heat shock protein)
MNEVSAPKMAKWPFFLGFLVLVSVTAVIAFGGERPLHLGELSLGVLCALSSAILCVMPFLLDYRALLKLTESDRLTQAMAQIQNLEIVARHIGTATSQWQAVQELAQQSVTSGQAMADRMAEEAKAFAEHLQKVNDAEKARLRLEVEKLHRAEGDWLQVTIGLLDHTFALHQAAERSGHPDLIQQLTLFQNACRDLVRRVGLVPFTAKAGEAFDSQVHQWRATDTQSPADARVGQTIATGFTFQGQFVRRALVTPQTGEVASTLASAKVAAEPAPLLELAPDDEMLMEVSGDELKVHRPSQIDGGQDLPLS